MWEKKIVFIIDHESNLLLRRNLFIHSSTHIEGEYENQNFKLMSIGIHWICDDDLYFYMFHEFAMRQSLIQEICKKLCKNASVKMIACVS